MNKKKLAERNEDEFLEKGEQGFFLKEIAQKNLKKN
jgi:hypothetical protein